MFSCVGQGQYRLAQRTGPSRPGARSMLFGGKGLVAAAPAALVGAAVVASARRGGRGQRSVGALLGTAVVAHARRALDRVGVKGRRCRALGERGGSLIGATVV